MALADTIEGVRNGKSPEVARLESIENRTPFQEKLLSVAGDIALSVAKSAGRVSTSAVDAVYTSGKKVLGQSPGAIKWENVPVLKNTPSYQRNFEVSKESGGNPRQELAKSIAQDVITLVPAFKGAQALKFGGKLLKGALTKAPKAVAKTVTKQAPKIKYSPYHGESFKKMTAPEFMSEYVRGRGGSGALRSEASKEYLKYIQEMSKQGYATAKDISIAKNMVRINSK